MIDGGALLDTVAATHFIDAVDVVVLALPERFPASGRSSHSQRSVRVADVQPLAVLMPTPRRPRERGVPRRSDTPDIRKRPTRPSPLVMLDRPLAP